MLPPATSRLAALLLAAPVLILLGWNIRHKEVPGPAPVGLFTSLPIMWGEAEDLSGMIASKRRPHRVRTELSRVGPVVALDTLEALRPDLAQLVVAQPRPLSPAENVAIDSWVRGGGQLLLFADPLLTAESIYQLGDPRRPQGTVLLSPILQRWGLELTFDERQPAGLRTVAVKGPAIPVNQAGRWQTRSAACRIEGEGLLAICQVGQGRITALADAEVLTDEDQDQIRAPAFASLLRRAFERR